MLSLLTIAVVLGQSPSAASSAELSAQVAALAAEFDAPTRTARDAAETKLIELGPAALEFLPPLGPGASAERTTRLNRVRAALYKAQVAESLRGSQVELNLPETKLSSALAEINKQSGNTVVDFRRSFGQQADDLPLVLDVPKVSFWEAVDRLSLAAGLQPYYFAGTDGLALVASGREPTPVPWPGKPAYVDYRGAFRIEVDELILSHNPAADQSALRVELSAAWEPRLRPMHATLAMRKLEAVDDRGAKLEPLNPDLTLEIPPQGKACRIDAAATFEAPPRSVKSLAKLRGSFDVLIPAALHTFRFTPLDVRQRRTESAGAVSLALEPPRLNNELVEATIRVTYAEAANALESHRAWFYKNPAYLEAADGTRTKPGTIELLRQSDNELTLNLLFSPAGDWRNLTLVYQTPAALVVVPAEFEFGNLKLP